MKTYTLIQLLMQTFAGSAVRRMKSCIVTVCTTATANLTVTIGAGEAGIKDNLLQAFPVLPFEIADEGIVSFPIRESVFFVSSLHSLQK